MRMYHAHAVRQVKSTGQQTYSTALVALSDQTGRIGRTD